MRGLLALLLLVSSYSVYADTMDHYINISNQIPQMQMKADSQSQAWARSAQSVMVIANESIAETLMQANDLARAEGRSLFCLPPGVVLNAAILNDLILQTYKQISSQQSDKEKMTVSQVAWLAVSKNYPCQQAVLKKSAVGGVAGVAGALMGQAQVQRPQGAQQMQHMNALNTN